MKIHNELQQIIILKISAGKRAMHLFNTTINMINNISILCGKKVTDNT